MPAFICAVSTSKRAPRAFALLEQLPPRDDERPSYALKALRRFEEGDVAQQLQDMLAENEDLAGHTTVVVQGGQPVARKLHKAGLTAVPVETRPPVSRDGDTVAVAEQTVVDTFEAVFRRSLITFPDDDDLVERAVRSLYVSMSDDAGAEDAPDHLSAEMEEELGTMPPEDDAAADLVNQSGGENSISMGIVADDRRDRDVLPMSRGEVGPVQSGLIDERLITAHQVDMGEDHDAAMALGLAVWYGEYSADEVPVTDQATMPRRVRDGKRNRREAARAR